MAGNDFSTELLNSLSPEERQYISRELTLQCVKCGKRQVVAAPLHLSDEALNTMTKKTECPKCNKVTMHELLQKGFAVHIVTEKTDKNKKRKKKIQFSTSFNNFVTFNYEKFVIQETLKEKGYKLPNNRLTWEQFYLIKGVTINKDEIRKQVEEIEPETLQKLGIATDGVSLREGAKIGESSPP